MEEENISEKESQKNKDNEKVYKKRILFIGMPDMALICLNKLAANKINIVGVVPPHKSESTHKLMVEHTKKLGFPLITFEKSLSEPEFLNKIKELEPDLGVVTSFNKKFPKEMLQIPKDGFINLHPSKLPDYRGGNPYSHVIMNGEEESAITLHFMDEGFDTGDIISQYIFHINDDETMGTLFYRTNDMCASMLYEALDYYEKKTFPRKPQPKNGIYKSAESLSFEKRNVFINWRDSAENIERFIRALNPFIGAYTYYKGVILRINSATVINKKHNLSAGVVYDTKDSLKIACGSNILQIDSLQFGAYFITNGKDLVNRIEIKKGDILRSEQA